MVIYLTTSSVTNVQLMRDAGIVAKWPMVLSKMANDCQCKNPDDGS